MLQLIARYYNPNSAMTIGAAQAINKYAFNATAASDATKTIAYNCHESEAPC